MKRKTKRLLRRGAALLLALVIQVSVLPAAALAADPADSSTSAVEIMEGGETSAFSSEVFGNGESSAVSEPDVSEIADGTSAEQSAASTTDTAETESADTSEADSSNEPEETSSAETDDFDPTADSGAGTGGESEDVAATSSEDLTAESEDNGDSASVNLESAKAGVTVSYAADATTTFKAGSLAAGQVWVDKSVKKTGDSETSFEESLSVYANEFTSTSEYATGNYVLVIDTTRSLYKADESGALFQAVVQSVNDLAVEICKNPLSNVAVIGFSSDQYGGRGDGESKGGSKNYRNKYATSVLLGMGNWNKAGSSLLTTNISSSNEYAWYVTASSAAQKAKVASTGKRCLSRGTFTQAGIAHAANILSAQTNKSDTNGYILLFTDGVPTYATTAWAAKYSASADQWASDSGYTVGDGRNPLGDVKADTKGYAYTLATMQYWNNYLSREYQNFALYAGLFSNDSNNKNAVEAGKWITGVTNNVTYIATSSSSGKKVTSGYPKNRTASTFANRSGTKYGVSYLKALLTASNLKKLGLSSASTFNAPCIAQFCDLDAEASAKQKKAALTHLIDNLESSIKRDKITQGGLKSGTNVVFTTKTGNYMTVSGAPVLYYNNTPCKGTRSGSTYTYSIGGSTCKVTVSTKDSQSTVTVTIPADLVNKNGVANSAYPIVCKFGVDLFSDDYREVYDLAGGDVTTCTNDYSENKSTVTFTTAADNPYYAKTGTDTVKKSANTTKTLNYVSQTVRAKSGKQSTATLGNNGKVHLKIQWGKIEIQTWEINQADETKLLPDVNYHLADADGNKILLDGKELSFTSAEAADVIECMPAGTYQIVADSVPAGFVLPEPLEITVKDSTETQHFDFYVPTILVDVWAVDKATGEKVEGVKASVYDNNGKVVYMDVTLEWLQEYVPAGDYTIKVTSVPERYLLPEDTAISVQAIREKQDFIIPLEHLGSITIQKYDAQNQPLEGVSFDLIDADGTVIMTKTTDKNGEAVFSGSNKLVPGTYTVTETKTGAGLTLLRDSIEVTIPVTMTDAEAQEQNADTSRGWHNTEEKVWYFYDVTYEISNTSSFAIPVTGGNPALLLLTGTVGLLGIGYVVFLRRGKRA